MSMVCDYTYRKYHHQKRWFHVHRIGIMIMFTASNQNRVGIWLLFLFWALVNSSISLIPHPSGQPEQTTFLNCWTIDYSIGTVQVRKERCRSSNQLLSDWEKSQVGRVVPYQVFIWLVGTNLGLYSIAQVAWNASCPFKFEMEGHDAFQVTWAIE